MEASSPTGDLTDDVRELVTTLSTYSQQTPSKIEENLRQMHMMANQLKCSSTQQDYVKTLIQKEAEIIQEKLKRQHLEAQISEMKKSISDKEEKEEKCADILAEQIDKVSRLIQQLEEAQRNVQQKGPQSAQFQRDQKRYAHPQHQFRPPPQYGHTQQSFQYLQYGPPVQFYGPLMQFRPQFDTPQYSRPQNYVQYPPPPPYTRWPVHQYQHPESITFPARQKDQCNESVSDEKYQNRNSREPNRRNKIRSKSRPRSMITPDQEGTQNQTEKQIFPSKLHEQAETSQQKGSSKSRDFNRGLQAGCNEESVPDEKYRNRGRSETREPNSRMKARSKSRQRFMTTVEQNDRRDRTNLKTENQLVQQTKERTKESEKQKLEDKKDKQQELIENLEGNRQHLQHANQKTKESLNNKKQLVQQTKENTKEREKQKPEDERIKQQNPTENQKDVPDGLANENLPNKSDWCATYYRDGLAVCKVMDGLMKSDKAQVAISLGQLTLTKLRSKETNRDKKKEAHCLSSLSQAFMISADYEQAQKYLQELLEILEELYGKRDEKLIPVLNNLAVAKRHGGSGIANVELLLKRAVAIAEKSPSVPTQQVVMQLKNLASVYNELGMAAEANVHLTKAKLLINRHGDNA